MKYLILLLLLVPASAYACEDCMFSIFHWYYCITPVPEFHSAIVITTSSSTVIDDTHYECPEGMMCAR